MNLGRLSPQVDAAVAVGAVGDLLAPDLVHERAITGEAAADKPLSPAMAGQVGGWKEFFPTEDPLHVDNNHWLTESAQSNWVLSSITGNADKLLGSADPEVEYTPLESMARAVLPFRKVRPGQEEGRRIRRIKAKVSEYKRELERATIEGDQYMVAFLNEQLLLMQQSVSQLKSQQAKRIKDAR